MTTANFILGNVATLATNLAVNVTGGSLTIVVGSAAGTTITSVYKGMSLPWYLIIMTLLIAGNTKRRRGQ